MNSLVARCLRLCRSLSRAYPYEFRAICGDGLERLGEDLAPIVWREQGVFGLFLLVADLALHLPVEYVSSLFNQLKEVTMTGDLFEGTWKSEKGKDQFDTSYAPGSPEQACLRFEATDSGYLLVAYGIKDGQAVAERPRPIIPDGKRRPVVDMNGRPIPGVPPGTVAFGRQADSHTLEGWLEVDGKVLGGGTYKVSEDGKTLTATMEGMGLKGPFKTVAVFQRVEPDPYTPRP
jgi:hypothetical protein